MGNLWEHRHYDEHMASRARVSLIGWCISWHLSFGLFVANLLLLILFPTTGVVHSIVGLVLGFILVVGSTAQLWEILNVETP